MLKKAELIIIIVLFVLFMSTTQSLATPNVILNGQKLSFEVPPSVEEGRTLVPLRAIFEALGATVSWDEANQTVMATKADISIKLKVGEVVGYKNNQAIGLQVAAKIVNGRTLVPLRFVSEALGASVYWDGNTETVIIKNRQIIINGSNPGFGKIILPDDSVYEGEIQNGLRNGQGNMKWLNGDKFQGVWINDLESGFGTYYFSNGDTLSCSWENGNPNIQATFTWASGNNYVGAFQYSAISDPANSWLSMLGLEPNHFFNSSKGDGSWIFWDRKGHGTMTLANGDKYEGSWVDDKMNGQGTYTWSDGDRYTGNFVDKLKSGQGTYTWPTGDKYTGGWLNDVRNGPGTFYSKYGYTFYQEYKNGLLLGAPNNIGSQPTATVYNQGAFDTLTDSVINSRIYGVFEGWSGSTIFKLENGQIWQQATYGYYYFWSYCPDVTIYRSGGYYKMHVEGLRGNIYGDINVVRLK